MSSSTGITNLNVKTKMDVMQNNGLKPMQVSIFTLISNVIENKKPGTKSITAVWLYACVENWHCVFTDTPSINLFLKAQAQHAPRIPFSGNMRKLAFGEGHWSCPSHNWSKRPASYVGKSTSGFFLSCPGEQLCNFSFPVFKFLTLGKAGCRAVRHTWGDAGKYWQINIFSAFLGNVGGWHALWNWRNCIWI